jgi:hypothetical protein
MFNLLIFSYITILQLSKQIYFKNQSSYIKINYFKFSENFSL